jgi:hypothetical protein
VSPFKARLRGERLSVEEVQDLALQIAEDCRRRTRRASSIAISSRTTCC